MEDTLEQSDVGRWNIFKLNSDKGLQSLEQSAPTTYLRFRSKENALTYQDNMFSAVRHKKGNFTLVHCLLSWEKNFFGPKITCIPRGTNPIGNITMSRYE